MDKHLWISADKHVIDPGCIHEVRHCVTSFECYKFYECCDCSFQCTIFSHFTFISLWLFLSGILFILSLCNSDDYSIMMGGRLSFQLGSR